MHTNEHESVDLLIETVIGAAYEVANILGEGFLEKVYERAMAREVAARGLAVRPHVVFPVHYKGQLVGEYIADMVVADRVIVELKCVDRFADEHTAQCINYLKASGLRFALLINFRRSKVRWKRIVYG
jgi:GxxExxY protein